MPNPVINRRLISMQMAAGQAGPSIAVDAYTPLNDAQNILQNGNVLDVVKPSRAYTATNTAILSGVGTGNITPLADYHANRINDPSDTRRIYTLDATLNFAANQHWTAFAWVNFTTLAGGFCSLAGNYDDNNHVGCYMGMWSTNWGMRGFNASNTDQHFDTGVAINLGVWYFVAGGYDGTNFWMQINNGARLTQAQASIHSCTSSWTLGNYAFTSTSKRGVDGFLGGVGLALRTLSLSDITGIYNSGAGRAQTYFHA